ncbi:hypothetical protein KUCAC02_020427, partial [Chaenocephalus aceratus]
AVDLNTVDTKGQVPEARRGGHGALHPQSLCVGETDARLAGAPPPDRFALGKRISAQHVSVNSPFTLADDRRVLCLEVL